MGAVYRWQHEEVNSLNAKVSSLTASLGNQTAQLTDRETALSALPNIVVGAANSPTDLIAFLSADNTQCYKNGGGSGYYKVVVQTNDEFAKMQYGCTAKGGTTPLGAAPAYILAKKTGGTWSLISPTNQWLSINGQQLPSCTMVNDNKVSKLVTPECWQGPALTASTANATRTAVPVTNS